MTRINTNISSLIAQHHLAQTNDQLQVALGRLSTGLRINSGKDDPAGLIASESLRSDISGINKAISNTQRADQIIATADAALGQVSQLLNSMRALVVEAANNGALSDDEIAANQLQVDSSLEAINRIALTTTFQGRKLLDGSLSFISDVSNVPKITDSSIEQANLGATGSMNVEVAISAPATQAELTNSSLAVTTANTTLEFTSRSSSVLGDISVIADSETQPVTIAFSYDGTLNLDEVFADYDSNSQVLTVYANASSATSITKDDIANAINAINGFQAQTDPLTGADPAGDFTILGTPPADDVLDPGLISISAAEVGWDYNDVEVILQADVADGAIYDSATKTLTVSYIPSVSTIDDIAASIDALDEFDASADSSGSALTQPTDDLVTATTGATGGGVLVDDLVFELVGQSGTQTFNFHVGTNIDEIVAAVNLVSDSTGVTAEIDSTTSNLILRSSEYGSDSLVGVTVIDEGPNGIFRTGASALRVVGEDIEATVNGFRADGRGNQLTVNTSSLAMHLTLDPNIDEDILRFTISGGGALFQLGGDVVSNQQARLGIDSVTASTLGGQSGRLYQLGSGQDMALKGDITAANRILEEVIAKVTGLRGRLGAFQATTLDSNSKSLTDTVANLTQSESTIRDADFAKESAELTRAQILVQSGTTVLGIANQNPQNVLKLLQ